MALCLFAEQSKKRQRGDIVVKLVKYDIQGKDVGSVEVLDDTQFEQLLDKSFDHSQSIKDYIVAIRNNARQWSANTKRRSDVKATGKKPHAQKGQGRSRQGDLAAPHYRGGAVVWGPRPKFDVGTRINKKEKRAAIMILLADKIQGDENGSKVRILQTTEMTAPKTKTMANFLSQIALIDRRVLVIGSAPEPNLVKSLRNIPKKEFLPLSQVNGYELVRAQQIVVLESAVEGLRDLLSNNKKAE
jgi:large subunit ribosomal protein L4